MFKVGDRVRLRNPETFNGAFGGVMEVYKIVPSCILAMDKVSGGGGFKVEQLELVVDLTDQELADKYREVRKESLRLADELCLRDYTVKNKFNPLVFSKTNRPKIDAEFIIEKTVTETISL